MPSKLTLNKETLRSMEENHMQHAVGGKPTQGAGCYTANYTDCGSLRDRARPSTARPEVVLPKGGGFQPPPFYILPWFQRSSSPPLDIALASCGTPALPGL